MCETPCGKRYFHSSFLVRTVLDSVVYDTRISSLSMTE